MTSARGIALVLALLVMSFLTAIGLGLALIVMIDRLAAGNLRGSVAMLYAADAAVELAARDLARLEDWNHALTGLARSAFSDGDPQGLRTVAGGATVDLTAATNLLNCRRTTGCTAAEMDASSKERPWGSNNPRWRLYAWGPMRNIVQFARPADCYLAVWVADDFRESDGDPESDALKAVPGHGVVRIRAEAYGAAGGRRAVEAELVRGCPSGTVGGCPGRIRVQSWQELRHAVP